MATWTVDINVTNRAERRVHIVCARSDVDDIRTYPADGQVGKDNVQSRLRAIMDNAFARYTKEVEEEAAQTSLINGWEDTATTYLNGLES